LIVYATAKSKSVSTPYFTVATATAHSREALGAGMSPVRKTSSGPRALNRLYLVFGDSMRGVLSLATAKLVPIWEQHLLPDALY
jgi:hypothetical protein